MANKLIERRTYDDWKRFCEQVQSSTAVTLGETPAQRDYRVACALADYRFFVRTYFAVYADADCADFQVALANRLVTQPRPADDPTLIAVAEWPREHAKSVHCDILIPLWMMAHSKLNGMILMGKNQDDAINLLGDVQAQLQYNNLFIHDFGEQHNFGDWQAGDFTTRGGIRFLAIGRDQSPRGARKGQRRPNYACIDDVDDDELVHNQKRVKKIHERIMGALFFALETRGATMVVAGNRIHAQSVLAHVVGDVKPGAPVRRGIYHSKVFAIDPDTNQPAWPQRYTRQLIENKLSKAGSVIGRKEFFHENHVEGSIFTDAMIRWVPPLPLADYKMIVGYFDPSFENKPTSDFKAVRVWGGYQTPAGEWQKHCLKAFVRKAEMQRAFEFMSDFEQQLPPGAGVLWYVERQFFDRPVQDALYNHNQKLRQQGKKALVVLTDTRIKENKYLRMVKMEPAYTDGEVFYNLNEIHNPDMLEGNNQLKGIEPGYTGADDSPDADEGAWYYLDQHRPGRDFRPVIGQRKNRTW